MATMSILGLYQYNPKIFNDMLLPDGVKLDVLVNNILMDYAELEVIYPNPDFFKFALGEWSKARIHVWEELQKTLEYEYNPLFNVDANEKEIETHDMHTNSESESTGTGTGTEAVQGFNSEDWAEANKTDSESAGTGKAQSAETGTIIREHIRQGNIGVTKTTELIRDQRDIVMFSVYEFIQKDFKNRFCLMVY